VNERSEMNVKVDRFVMRWLWEETTKKALISLFIAVFLVLSSFIVMGPMFGIAALVDGYSGWALLLYLPWLITLPIAIKPLAWILGWD
jgi:hypothetical protein